jgi:glutamate racemase
VSDEKRTAPVGIYDSGVGGLSILSALTSLLHQERFYYVADGFHCPYGDRAEQEIIQLSLGVARHLVESGCKAIVVACNTISATSLPALRAAFPKVPIIGMVPAVKPAIELTHTGVVGVLATSATVKGRLYLDVLARYGGDTRVVSQPCPGLVERIEAGDLDGPDTERLVRACLNPIMAAGADVIVLGCSHYPFVRPLIERLVGPGVRIIEPSDAIALQTRRVLERQALCSAGRSAAEPQVHFATSGDTRSLEASVLRLVGISATADQLVWRDGALTGAPAG